MSARAPRDIRDFAREIGYTPSACPDCRHVRPVTVVRTPCANCGGSGRLWTSARGSLDDGGLARLHHLHHGGREGDGA